MRVMLIGNPNCGKTTLFNALTGDNQRVGNWPGVTVEKKMGEFCIEERAVQLVDLPGLYSLTLSPHGKSQDEQITVEAIVSDAVDVIINVIDTCHLERHLYLTTQLLELGKPVVIALNMTDIAHQRGIAIDADALSQQIGCLVVPIQAHRQQGLSRLKQSLCKASTANIKPLVLSLPPILRHARDSIEALCRVSEGSTAQSPFFWANRLLEGDAELMAQAGFDVQLPLEVDILMADVRYQTIHQIVGLVQKKQKDASEHLTAKIDRIVLHRIWALPIFFGVMYLMFFMAINVGGVFQAFFDLSSDAVFVQGAASVLDAIHAPQWSIALIANGLGKGINTTLTFIPVIFSMYFFLALLETSGYMARAAFVVDKAMRALGLPGKSFVPMIVGFGCNVPAIMAARTLDSEQDRLLTILMSPFMSCSARLTIYAIFVAAFFPNGGHNIVFSLYLIGILMAVLTGFLLRKTVFKMKSSPLLLELPAYHRPSWGRLMKQTTTRLRHFIIRAGQFIIPVCVLLGGLNSLTIGGRPESVLSMFGQWVTPLFAPMGLHPDNWAATVGLLTGMLAKEVVVGTLHTLYSQVGHLASTSPNSFDFWASIQSAFQSIGENTVHLGQLIIHPFSAGIDVSGLPSDVSNIMVQHFDGPVGAYAYLLFVLLYIPCVSTIGVIRQEAGRRFMWFSIVWSLVLAYGVSVAFYQLATAVIHPLQTVCWVMLMLSMIVSIVLMMRKWLSATGKCYATTAA
jgi:ferrous iron transport protein B